MSAKLTDIFQIPLLSENNVISYNDCIWHSFLAGETDIYAMVNFVVKDSTVFYTISEAYVNEINDTGSDVLQMYFDSDSFYCNGTALGKQTEFKDLENIDLNELYLNGQSVSQKITENFQIRSVVDIYGGKMLSNYPVFSQGSYPLCWAGTVASMVKYEFPTTYRSITISDVCNAIDCHAGANWTQIVDALEYYFLSPYRVDTIESYLSKSQIKTVIGNDDPALMSSLDSNGKEAHITALIGYKETASLMSIKIMNPGTGEQEWGNYSASAPYTFSYNGDTYTWDKSIRLLYD